MGFEINIYQCVKFINDDINIVGANVGGKDRKFFLFDLAGMVNEFLFFFFYLYFVKVLGDLGYLAGVVYCNDGRGNIFWVEVEVVNVVVGI